jgi:hypothetical protein
VLTLPLQFLTFIGPNWPVENGSVMGPLNGVSLYTLQIIRKLQTEYIRSIAPKQSVTDAFNAHCQEWIRHTVWVEECRSWYKNNETGRVNAVWPGSSLHYMEAIKMPRYEDFEITYLGPAEENRWAFLGLGTTRELVEKGDVSPYINVENIDPEWMKAIGIDDEKVQDIRVQRLKDGSGYVTPTGVVNESGSVLVRDGQKGEGPGDDVEMTDKI